MAWVKESVSALKFFVSYANPGCYQRQWLFRPDNLASKAYEGISCCLTKERPPARVGIRSKYPEKHLFTLIKNEDFLRGRALCFFASYFSSLCRRFVRAVPHSTVTLPDRTPTALRTYCDRLYLISENFLDSKKHFFSKLLLKRWRKPSQHFDPFSGG